MASLKTVRVSGSASGGQAASAPEEFVRKQEFDGFNSGTARLGHRHDAADIDGLIPLLVSLMGDELEGSDSIDWTSGTQPNVRLKPNGGLQVDAEGLYLDSGTVSRPGHIHAAADITDLSTVLYTRLQAIARTTDTIEWEFSSGTNAASVRLQPAGGLLADGDGVGADFGSGTGQVARGDHAHAQLHDPVAFQASNTITITLAGQTVTMEVTLAGAGGLTVAGGGVAVDFGSGTNQVARGDHSHPEFHDAATAIGDASLTLGVDADQHISGTVRRDPAPPGGGGRLGVSANGIYTVLGTASDEAAAGNHGHSVATQSADGFMSASDKLHLDSLWLDSGTGTASGTLPTSGTMDILQVRRIRFRNATTGQTRDVYLGDDGLMKGLTP